MLSAAIRDGIPVKPPADAVNFRIAAQQSRNAEEALLAVFNGCALVTHAVFDLYLATEFTFGEFINRMRGQLADDDDDGSVALACLDQIDLSWSTLSLQDLFKAN